jgi:hypothetical protein
MGGFPTNQKHHLDLAFLLVVSFIALNIAHYQKQLFELCSFNNLSFLLLSSSLINFDLGSWVLSKKLKVCTIDVIRLLSCQIFCLTIFFTPATVDGSLCAKQVSFSQGKSDYTKITEWQFVNTYCRTMIFFYFSGQEFWQEELTKQSILLLISQG